MVSLKGCKILNTFAILALIRFGTSAGSASIVLAQRKHIYCSTELLAG
jgi:hypothetical protein